MAASKAEELRRLMKQQNNESKKINHPLAKYNSLGQITCQLCSHILKSNLLWNTHLQSRKHKKSVTALKERKVEENINKKRAHESNADASQPQAKKPKGVLPTDFFDNTSSSSNGNTQSPPVKKEVKGILKNANNKTSEPVIVAQPPQPSKAPVKTISGEVEPKNETELKSKDEDEKTSEEGSGDRKRKLSSSSEQLPEGFFDDPKQDAKARNIEYKDPKEEEWEKFQKMIQEETKISENIQEEEDEESEIMKDMDELNNMKTCLSRVDRLKNLIRKKNIESSKTVQGALDDSSTATGDDTMKKKKDLNDSNEEEDDEDDDDMESMFNWRAKMA